MSRRGAGSDDAARQRFYGRFRISADIDRQDCDARGQEETPLDLKAAANEGHWNRLQSSRTDAIAKDTD